MWFEYFELLLSFLIACLFFFLVQNALPFVLCMWAGSLSISSERCRFHCSCVFMGVVSLCFILCFVFWMSFLFGCPWIILWFCLFLFCCICTWPILFSGVVGQYQYFVFVGLGVLWFCSYYTCCFTGFTSWKAMFLPESFLGNVPISLFQYFFYFLW